MESLHQHYYILILIIVLPKCDYYIIMGCAVCKIRVGTNYKFKLSHFFQKT